MGNLCTKVAISIVVFILAVSILLVGAGIFITADIDADRITLSPGEYWFDDWFSVTRLDDHTYAIGEPRYWQKNYSYLIVGTERALLFDTGPGVRDITSVTAALSEVPITILSSHPHYDHIGNNYRFDSIAWVDVPAITSEIRNEYFQPSFHRGFTIRSIPPFKISEWWKPEQEIDLGQRRLKIFHVPGHEDGSFALLDADRHQLFTGDFVYPGWLVAFAPTSDLKAYLRSVRYLLRQTSGNETIYGAHAVERHPSPILPFTALVDLERVLDSLDSKSAVPKQRLPIQIYTVNREIDLYLPPFH